VLTRQARVVKMPCANLPILTFALWEIGGWPVFDPPRPLPGLCAGEPLCGLLRASEGLKRDCSGLFGRGP